MASESIKVHWDSGFFEWIKNQWRTELLSNFESRIPCIVLNTFSKYAPSWYGKGKSETATCMPCRTDQSPCRAQRTAQPWSCQGQLQHQISRKGIPLSPSTNSPTIFESWQGFYMKTNKLEEFNQGILKSHLLFCLILGSLEIIEDYVKCRKTEMQIFLQNS